MKNKEKQSIIPPDKLYLKTEELDPALLFRSFQDQQDYKLVQTTLQHLNTFLD